MNPNVNPLSNITNLKIRHMIMQILAFMWSGVFSLYIVDSLYVFGITAIAHLVFITAIFVTALVNRLGKVEQIGKISGPEVFHSVAKAAAMQWEFEPAIQNDKPVKVWVSLPFTFQLN